MPTAKRDGDHDLLVRIDEKLNNLKSDFQDFRNNTTKDMSLKADQTEVVRIETEMNSQSNSLEQLKGIMYKALGALALIELASVVVVAIHYLRQ